MALIKKDLIEALEPLSETAEIRLVDGDGISYTLEIERIDIWDNKLYIS